MRLDRCLLAACVMLSQVCDSALAHPAVVPANDIDVDVRANVKSVQHCVRQSVKRDGLKQDYHASVAVTVDNHRITRVRILNVPPKLVECFEATMRKWKMTVERGEYRTQILVGNGQ